MSKFKIGDRVRVANFSDYVSLKRGAGYTVSNVYGNYIELKESAGPFYAHSFELVSNSVEAKSKFKPGDKVRCIDDSVRALLKVGSVYTVSQVINDNIELAELGKNFLADRFELVEVVKVEPKSEPKPEPKFKVGDKVLYDNSTFTIIETKQSDYRIENHYKIADSSGWQTWAAESELKPALTELDRLIDEANKGEDALNELFSKYSKDVFYNDKPLFTFENPHPGARFTKIEKPKFESFVTKEGWTIALEGTNIHIGCQSFDYKKIKDAFEYLIKSNGTVSDCYSLKATKSGIKYWSSSSNHTLNWEDAERILNQLELIEGAK